MSEKSLELANRSRLQAVEMCAQSRAAHIGSSLSVIDILSVLYSGGAQVSPESVAFPERDHVIVSKGHAAAGTYAVLAERGFFPLEWLKTYGMNGSALGGHVTNNVPGVELSTGSLGHGLPFGNGLALAAKRRSSRLRVFVVISDGECNEGTTWESALFAAHHGLSNLTVLVDRNGLQSLAPTEETLRLEPFSDKWQAFGWMAIECDGHNHDELFSALTLAQSAAAQPQVIVCNTIKGKGVSFMENSILWHYRSPDEEDLELATSELRGCSS